MHCKLFAFTLVVFMLANQVSRSVTYANDASEEQESVEALDDLSLSDLIHLEITTGSFLDLDLTNSPLSMTIITREMVRTSGARNMSELLEIYVPGFTYNYNKWVGTLWAMRGVSNDRNTKILYLVNGHKMNTQARNGFQSETSLGLLGDISRVEVLRGPAGLVYGCGAIAGIVNVVTEQHRDENGSSVSVGGNTDGSKEIDAQLYGQPAENHHLSFSAGFKYSEGFPFSRVRVYGKTGWPTTLGEPYGCPTDGRYGATPGNMRVSGDYSYRNFNLYFRATSQTENADALITTDPWPEIIGFPDSTAPVRFVDDHAVLPDDPFWHWAEAWGISRRQYRTDNLMIEGSYEVPMEANSLKLKVGYDRNTTRTQENISEKYASGLDYIEGTRVRETFGESRYGINTTYLLKSIPNLQAAFGLEDRIDAVGPDMNGDNFVDGVDKHYMVKDIVYNTFTLFGEGFYDIIEALGVHAGLRLDVHTRATMFSPKVALIARPLENHTFKMIFQSASNNGSVDNLEYSRNHIDDDGNIVTEPRPTYYTDTPSVDRGIIQPVPNEATLHSLKPEQVYSLEGVYVGNIAEVLTVEVSGAWGRVKDLFAWSGELYRVVNVGEYQYVNGDFDVKVNLGKLRIGANHTIQKPYGTDVKKQARKYAKWANDSTGHDGQFGYPDGVNESGDTLWEGYYSLSDTISLNVVKNSVTFDGEYFLNLPANLTKLYMIYSPFEWLSFNTNLRLVWGYPGRKPLLAENDDDSYYYGFYHEIEGQSLKDYLMESVSKKWNFGINFYLPKNFDISFYAYNILGTDNHSYTRELDRNTVNTFRVANVASPDERNILSTDQRAVGLMVTKHF